MEETTAIVRRAPSLELRAARFEDVAAILRLVNGAVAFGCRADYDATQRRAVYEAYASVLFVEAVGPFDTLVAEVGGRIVGFAQLDASDGRLRALFVDADLQGRGVGRAVLADIEALASRRGCVRVYGAMSLNAVPFYTRAGFRARGGEEPLMSIGSGAGVRVPIVRMEKRLRP